MKKTINFKHRFTLLIFTIFLFLFSYWIFTPLFSAEPTCTLKMGWEPWKPYQYIDENKHLTGLDIELIGEVVKNMKCEIKFIERPWTRLILEAETGEMDLVAGASMVENRKKWAHFSDAYRHETRVLFVRKGESEKFKFKSLQDIIGTKFQFGVTRGAYNGKEYDRLIKNPEFKKHIQIVNKEIQNHKKLMTKRIDGFIMDHISGTNLLREENILNKVEIYPIKIHSAGIYVLFSKKSTTPLMVEKFNKSLAELKANGTYDKIIKKYLE